MKKSNIIGLQLLALMDILITFALLFVTLRLGVNPWAYITIGYALLSLGSTLMLITRVKKQRENKEKKYKDRDPWERN